MEEQRTIEAIQADEGQAYAQLDRLQEDSRLLAGRLVSFNLSMRMVSLPSKS